MSITVNNEKCSGSESGSMPLAYRSVGLLWDEAHLEFSVLWDGTAHMTILERGRLDKVLFEADNFPPEFLRALKEILPGESNHGA